MYFVLMVQKLQHSMYFTTQCLHHRTTCQNKLVFIDIGEGEEGEEGRERQDDRGDEKVEEEGTRRYRPMKSLIVCCTVGVIHVGGDVMLFVMFFLRRVYLRCL